jgi:hypothetical protein
VNDKLYIHEFINIIGQNRANYMHHMTANFSPTAQQDRHQLCYGEWGVVGSTLSWPTVLNLWEEDGFDGMASSFRFEFNHPTLQDPKLAKWWAEAASYRSSGADRLLVPAPWTKTIEELCATGVRGEVYAHEQIQVPQGTAAEYLERIAHDAVPLFEPFGWVLAGAWQTAMCNQSEVFLLWAIPSWERWAEYEKAELADTPVGKWRRSSMSETTGARRFLLVDSPLCPFRTGRQPSRADREGEWSEL